jgi:hypothetical protein
MAAPKPIKSVGTLQVKDSGELLWPLDASPTEEFIEGFGQYLRHPTGSVSSAFDKRVFSHFEGTAIIFNKVPVADFKSNYLGAIHDAIRYANDFVADVCAKRDAQASAHTSAKDTEKDELAQQRAEAEQVKLDE